MTNTNTLTPAMSHKEMTAHIRKRIKVNGIKARVWKYTSCGVNYISIDVPSYDGEFSDDEQRKVRMIAKGNGLTLSRGFEIQIEQMTNVKNFTFVML